MTFCLAVEPGATSIYLSLYYNLFYCAVCWELLIYKQVGRFGKTSQKANKTIGVDCKLSFVICSFQGSPRFIKTL